MSIKSFAATGSQLVLTYVLAYSSKLVKHLLKGYKSQHWQTVSSSKFLERDESRLWSRLCCSTWKQNSNRFLSNLNAFTSLRTTWQLVNTLQSLPLSCSICWNNDSLNLGIIAHRLVAPRLTSNEIIHWFINPTVVIFIYRYTTSIYTLSVWVTLLTLQLAWVDQYAGHSQINAR